MDWASYTIEKLKMGESVQIRPKGHSMRGKIESGNLVTIEPIDSITLAVGDIVLCRVKGNSYVHLIKAIKEGRYLIGNNRGGINGWIQKTAIYGKVIRIEP